MTLTSLLQHTIRISRRTTGVTQDDYGNADDTWTEDTADVAAFVQPDGQTEIRSGQDTVIANVKAFLEPDSDITEKDRFEFDGRNYQVIGVATHDAPGYSVYTVAYGQVIR